MSFEGDFLFYFNSQGEIYINIKGQPCQKVVLIDIEAYTISLSFEKNSLKCIYLFTFGCAGFSLLYRLSLVAESRDYSLVVVCRLLVELASTAGEHRL